MQDRRSQMEGLPIAYKPVGHRILILLDDIELVTKQESVIQLVEDTKKKEQEAHMGATVLKMGKTCYNLEHMGDEPWCKVGDRITIAPHSGKRMPGHPRIRLINDEDVTSVEETADGFAELLNMIEAADKLFIDKVEEAS